MPNIPSTISDAYLYDELLRHIGPKEAEKWFKESVLHPVGKHRNSSQSIWSQDSSSCTTGSSNETSELCQSTLYVGAKEILNTPTKVRFDSLVNGASKLQDQDWITALDIEITPESSENIGLLFTDAAHLIFHDRGISESMSRRKSSFF